MYCDSCGTELQAGNRFCPSCGKSIGVSPGPAGGRVGRHVRILSILWFATSALNLIGAGVLLVLANTLFAHLERFPGPAPPPAFLQGLLSALGLLLLFKALAGFAAGWGLLQRESWARPLTLVLGFISLIDFPIGTALGIYTIWVLLSSGADEEYSRLSRAA
jgi:zinc-ribbon domain